MDGHGIYVFAAYVAAAVGLIGIVVYPLLRLRAGHKRLERERARDRDI